MTTHTPDVGSFNQILEAMAGADFFTGLLPFVVTYILFFLTLQKVPLFDEDKQDRFAALVSIVFAFFVARFVSQNQVYQEFFVDYLGFIAVTIIGLLGLLIVLAMVGVKIKTDSGNANLWGITLGIIVLTGFLVTDGASILIPEQISADTSVISDIVEFTIRSGLIWIIVVGGIIYWTLKPADNDEGGGDEPVIKIGGDGFSPFKGGSSGGDD